MILDRLLAPSSGSRVRAGTPAPDDDYWYSDVGTVSRSGANVTPDSALRVSAVLACVRVLAETIASLPWILYRRTSDGGKERAYEHSLYERLHDQPNSWQTSFDFVEMMIGHCALRGNAYAWIITDRRGHVDELIPLRPDRMTVYRLPNRQLRYEFRREEDGIAIDYRQNQILHLRWMSSDGVTGMSPIELARESVGLALSTEAHGARVFKNKAVPGAVVTHPASLKPEARANLKRVLEAQYAQENVHRTLVLEEGMSWSQMGMTNEDAQFLETRKFQKRDIASIFRIQPHLIGDLEDATYSNIEMQSLEFVVHTLRPWLVRIERAVQRDLLTDVERQTYFSEFLVDGLLRGDIKSRYEAYGIGIERGFLTRNEARRLENRNPMEGLDDMLVPLNMGRAADSAEELMQQETVSAQGEEIARLQSALEAATVARDTALAEANKQQLLGLENSEAAEKGQKRLAERERDLALAQKELKEATARYHRLEAALATASAVSEDMGKLRSYIIEDIAERISMREQHSLERIAMKANEDRDRFNRQVDKIYDGHRDYVCRTLAPFGRFWLAKTGQSADFDDVIEIAVYNPRDTLHTVDEVVECIASWKIERPEQIATALNGRFDDGSA